MTNPDVDLPEGDFQPVQTDNGTYDLDGEQDVAQNADLDYSLLSDDGAAL